jgi:hypothetical protein
MTSVACLYTSFQPSTCSVWLQLKLCVFFACYPAHVLQIFQFFSRYRWHMHTFWFELMAACRYLRMFVCLCLCVRPCTCLFSSPATTKTGLIVSGHDGVHTFAYICIHTYIYIYIYIHRCFEDSLATSQPS